MEAIFDEPADTGLSAQLSAFWNAWGVVAETPRSEDARVVLLAAARTVTGTLNSFGRALAEVGGADVTNSASGRTLQAYRATLDAVATALAGTVNEAQRAGFDLRGATGAAMFGGADAAGLAVVLTDPAGVAAARIPGGGLDNGVADSLSQAALRPGSADSIFTALVGNVATSSAAARQRAQTRDAGPSHLGGAGAPTFAASSRVLAAIDAMLDTLVDHVRSGGPQSPPAVPNSAYRLSSLREQLSSGRRITTSADDPDGTVTVLELRASVARGVRYATNSTDAISWLDTADSAYAESESVLMRVRALASRALDSSGADAGFADIPDTADEIDQLRSRLLTLANSSFAGRPVLGGATADAVAYDDNGDYVGDTGSVARTVGPRATVDVAVSGPEVYGSGVRNVFAELHEIASSLRTDPISLTSSALERLDDALDRVRSARAAATRRAEQVQRLAAARAATGATLAERLRAVEDVDVVDAALRAAAANAGYQAALHTITRVDNPSLLDFLRPELPGRDQQGRDLPGRED